MNMHKSDGISKKSFKKYNSIEETKVTIEEESNNVEITKSNENKGRKISGIRRPSINIINNVHELENKNIEKVVNNVESKEEEMVENRKIIFDSEDENLKNGNNFKFSREGKDEGDKIIYRKEVIEEDKSIIFDTESDKNELSNGFKFEKEKKIEKKDNAIINNEEKEEDKVIIDDRIEDEKDQKKYEKERVELRKEKRNEILKNIKLFEKTEKNLNDEISEIIKEQDKTLDKKVFEEKIVFINNKKNEDKKKSKVNSDIKEKNNDKLDDKTEEKEIDIEKNIKPKKDEYGLIIKESSELDKVKIDKNELNLNKYSFNNKKQYEVKSVLTTDNNQSKNLLSMIIGIVVLISILIGGFIFYKQIKFKKQIEEKKITTDKNIEDKNIEDEKKEDDIKKQEESSDVESKVRKLFSNCSYFSNNLSSCTPYSCKFEHPDTHEIMRRDVLGIKDGKCEYSETLVDKKILSCNYDKESQKLVAEFYNKVLVAKFIGQAELKEEKVNGIENIVKKMVEEGICVVKENTEILVGDCPEGMEYRGEYNNSGILMPICVDSTLVCEKCIGCVDENKKNVIDRIEGIGKCEDCSNSTDCIEGYHCFNNLCVANETLLNEMSCSADNTNCEKLPCKNCLGGSKYCNKGEKDWDANLANKCVDCTDTKYCEEGFKCENYKCVVN